MSNRACPPQTLAALADAIAKTNDIDPRYQAEVVRDIHALIAKRSGAALLRPLPATLRPHLAVLGGPDCPFVSKDPTVINPYKRGENVRSSIRFALRWYAIHYEGQTKWRPMSFSWMSALSLLPQEARGPQVFLSRFIGWANLVGIDPTDVCDDTLVAYASYLRDTAAKLNETQVRGGVTTVVRRWNRLVESVAEWPGRRIAAPPLVSWRSFTPRSAFSADFLADLDQFSSAMTTVRSVATPEARFASLDGQAGARARDHRSYRGVTLTGRLAMLRVGAAHLARAKGVPVSDIKSIAELVVPENARQILIQADHSLRAHRLARQERFGIEAPKVGTPEEPESLRTLAVALLLAARRYVGVTAAIRGELEELVDLSPRPRGAMAPKNLRVLRQIGEEQLHSLFVMPATLINPVLARLDAGERVSKRELIDTQVGVAIALLLHDPLRISNLRSMLLGEHLLLPGFTGGVFLGNDPARIIFRPHETKANRELSAPLPKDLVALLQVYVTRIMPLMGSVEQGTPLFPGEQAGQPKVGLGPQIQGRLVERLRVPMTSHMFRHLLAMIYLQQYPGRYDVVRKILGHSSQAVTEMFYTGLETDALFRHVGEVLARMKARYGIDPTNLLMNAPPPRSKTKH